MGVRHIQDALRAVSLLEREDLRHAHAMTLRDQSIVLSSAHERLRVVGYSDRGASHLRGTLDMMSIHVEQTVLYLLVFVDAIEPRV